MMDDERFQFSCYDCPIVKKPILYSRCAERGACWLSNGSHPVDDVMRDTGIDPTDMYIFPSKFVIDKGIAKPCDYEVTRIGKLVFELANVEAMRRRKERMNEFGFKE
jgi:hypothetical protein